MATESQITLTFCSACLLSCTGKLLAGGATAAFGFPRAPGKARTGAAPLGMVLRKGAKWVSIKGQAGERRTAHTNQIRQRLCSALPFKPSGNPKPQNPLPHTPTQTPNCVPEYSILRVHPPRVWHRFIARLACCTSLTAGCGLLTDIDSRDGSETHTVYDDYPCNKYRPLSAECIDLGVHKNILHTATIHCPEYDTCRQEYPDLLLGNMRIKNISDFDNQETIAKLLWKIIMIRIKLGAEC